MLVPAGAVFDHTAVAAPRIRDLLPLYHEFLGGTFVLGGDNPAFGYRAVQLSFANGTKIELMEPLVGSSFFDSFFRRGGGLHHVTFLVDDVVGASEDLQQRGYTPFGLNVARDGWQEVFLHPREADGVLVQLGAGSVRAGEHLTLDEVLAGRGDNGTGTPSPAA